MVGGVSVVIGRTLERFGLGMGRLKLKVGTLGS